jgi:hypothetical protein
MKTSLPFLSMFLLTVAACTNSQEPSIETPGPEFFPLQTGTFITYQVDSARIIQNSEQAFSYQLRISVGSSFRNDEGNTSYILQREERNTDTDPWKPAGTWTTWTSIQNAVVTEGTTSYIKLKFPLSRGLKWNGNALNSLGGDDLCSGSECDRYEVTSVDPLVVVRQDSTKDILKKDVRFERYQKDIGLIYKESEVLNYCSTGSCPTGVDYVVDGTRYKWEMIDHGTL